MNTRAMLLSSITPTERLTGRFLRAPDHGEVEAENHEFTGGDFDADLAENGKGGLDSGDEGEEGDDQSDELDGGDDGDGGDEGNEPDDTGQPGKGKEGKRLPRGVQRRIDRLSREAKEAREEVDRLRNGGNQRGGDDAGKTPDPNIKPVLDDFDTYEEWIEALTDFKADQRFKRSEGERAAQETTEGFQTRLKEGRKAFPDWDEVVSADVKVPKAAADAIMELDEPAAVIYFLSDNPEEADRIRVLSDARQMVEIGKLEAKLAKPAKVEDKIARKQSTAPAPITPVRGEGKVTRNLEDMDTDEFIRVRNKQDGVKRTY